MDAVTRTLAYRFVAGLACALFVLLQGASMAHAAQFGSDHSHDGVVCEAVIVAEEEAEVLPPLPAAAVLPEPPVVPATRAVLHSAPVTAFAARAPPVRGPPPYSC